MSEKFLSLPCFIEIHVFNSNNVDPGQMPCSAVSDLGLHCLLMSLLWKAKVKTASRLSQFYYLQVVILGRL